MFVKKFNECAEITALDNCTLRELLSPHGDSVESRYSLAFAKVAPGMSTKPHALATTEVYYIVSGTGEMHVDEESQAVTARDTIYIPARAVQYVENTGTVDLEFLCIVDPAWRIEDEIQIP